MSAYDKKRRDREREKEREGEGEEGERWGENCMVSLSIKTLISF